MLDENTSDIQGATGIKTTVNGPQGHVSARTVASVAMMDKGLPRLYGNLGKFSYKHTNLLSCMTLDVENCHSPNPLPTISKGTCQWQSTAGQSA